MYRCIFAVSAVLILVQNSECLAANPELVADIRSLGNSEPSNLVVYQDALYFGANDGAHGKELWKYDGMSVSLAGDLNSGTGWSDPSEFLIYENTLYFTALHSGHHGRELWKWNGNSAQRLSLLEQVDLDAGGRGPKLAGYQGAIYFAGMTLNHGTELWSWKNNQVARKTDLARGSLDSSVSQLITYQYKLFFSATDQVSGLQLWNWNGINASKAFHHPIGQPSGTYSISYKEIEGLLYFSDEDEERGQELWIWDGFNYPTVIDILPGVGSAAPGNFTEYNGHVYFTASDPIHGRELWKWDGSEASIVVDVRPGGQSSTPQWLTVFDGALYFTANDSQFRNELWKWDGTQATLVADINPGPISDDIYYLTVFGDALYFSASDPEHGRELWRLRAGFGIGGDFDKDGDVDGKDLIIWQRGGSPNPGSIADLRVWQENYGAAIRPNEANNLAVPEPQQLYVLIALASLTLRSPFSASSTRQSVR